MWVLCGDCFLTPVCSVFRSVAVSHLSVTLEPGRTPLGPLPGQGRGVPPQAAVHVGLPSLHVTQRPWASDLLFVSPNEHTLRPCPPPAYHPQAPEPGPAGGSGCSGWGRGVSPSGVRDQGDGWPPGCVRASRNSRALQAAGPRPAVPPAAL